MENDKQVTIQSVDKALSVLDLFIENDELGISEISRMTLMGKSTVARLVFSLTKSNFLKKNEATNKYRLGMKLSYFGTLVNERDELAKHADAFMAEMSKKYQLSCHLVVLEGTNIRFIHKINSGQIINMKSRIGGTMPAYCTATGKSIMAHLPTDKKETLVESIHLESWTKNTITNKDALRVELTKIQKQGYSEDNEESELGLCCIAAPVFDFKGHVIAAISLSGQKEAVYKSKKEIIKDLKEASWEVKK